VIDALDPARAAAFWRATLRVDLDATECVPPSDWLRLVGGRLVAHGEDLARPFPNGANPPDGPVHTLAPGLRFFPRESRRPARIACTSTSWARSTRSPTSDGAPSSAAPRWRIPHAATGGMFDPEGNEFCLHDPRLDG
jgi:Glyoxalase-like domain